MKLYAPSYYQDFKCIADRCTHSCCIGWEIDVDSDTLQKYDALSGEYANEIRNSIDRDETPHFHLCDGERCPHLDARGLCKIILSHGEDALCDICREHPRFYHETNHGERVCSGVSSSTLTVVLAISLACFVLTSACLNQLRHPIYIAIESTNEIHATPKP